MAKTNKQRYQEQKARKKTMEDNDFLNSQADLLNRKMQDHIENAKELGKLRQDLLKGMVDEVDNLDQQKKLLKDYEKSMQLLVDGRSKTARNLKEEIDALKKVIKVEERRRDLQSELQTKADGMLDGLEGQIKKVPIIGDFLASTMDFKGLKKKMGKILKGVTQQFVALTAAGVPAGKAIGMSFRGAIKPIMSFGATLWASLAPLLPIILPIIAALYLFKKALGVDQQVADLSREMGIGNDEAREMVTNFNDLSSGTNNLNISTKGLIQAQKELASSIGMTAQYTGEMLKDQILLTKYMGMSGDQAANFQKIAAGAGMSTREMQREVAGTVQQLNDATGLSVDFAGVMREISDLSGEMRARFNGNVKEMALAVAQAKALGTTLQESSDAAQNLLNMESSLKAEMKARMLTGVNINNDEIRRAQLMGDQSEVLRLQAKQMNEIGDISNKLPHEQRAIADAMGMSVDQLVKMNEQQTMLRKLNVDNLADLKTSDILNSNLTKQEKDKLLLQREQMSQQEKMAALTDKLSAAFDEIAVVLVPVISYLLNLVMSQLKFLMQPLKTISGIFSGIGMIIDGDIQGGLMKIGKSIVDLILSPFKYIADMIGGIFGIEDTSGKIGNFITGGSDAEEINDGVITPTGEVIKTNPMDYIMAVKNPFDMLGGLASGIGGMLGGGGGIDYDKLAAALASQPLQIIVDGKVVSAITRKQNTNKSYNRMMG
jgi:hypothetical protein